jgi:hypothetical protein
VLAFILNLPLTELRERAGVPKPMQPLANSEIAQRAGHVRQLTDLPFSTGTERLEGPEPNASRIKSQARPASGLEIAAVRVHPRAAPRRCTIQPLNVIAAILVMLFGLLWCDGFSSRSRLHPLEQTGLAVDIDSVVDQIIKVESNGDPDAQNKRSSATGLGQFVKETWLILIRAHRPDLVKGRSEGEILEMRRDAGLAREITLRFTERNAWILRKRGLPITPGTLYLAHFAGGAGAVAILSAEEQADAATTMAKADATRRTDREKLIKLNPFLKRLTVADLKLWADRKMRVSRS